MKGVLLGLLVVLSMASYVSAGDCANGSCRVERLRTVERGHVKRDRHVERVRLFRR